MQRKRIKKKYNTGGTTGGDALAGALQGFGMGSQFGLPGMLLGTVGGGLMGLNQGTIRKNNELIAGGERELAEEQRELEERIAEQSLNNSILQQYNLKGYNQPRFEGGGTTGDGLAQTKDYGIRDVLDGVKRAKSVTPQQHKTKTFHVGMYPALQPLTAALGQMSPEEWESLQPQINKIVDDALQMQADGKTSLGEGLGFFKDLDLSFVKPIREKAGISKGELVDSLFSAVDPQGNLSWGERTAMGAAARLKDFEGGGDTDPNSTPPYFNAVPQPNMPMGRELRHERGMPYYMPVDSPNGSIRQWEPSTMDYLKEAFGNYMNPFRAVAEADYNQRTDNYNHEGGLMMQAGLTNRDQNYADGENRNAILPDWVYSMFGTEKKAMGGMTGGPNYEVEGGEMMQYKPGDQPATYGQGGMSRVASNEFEVKGPSHAQGGVKASDNKGARVYSDKLKVDAGLMAKLSKL